MASDYSTGVVSIAAGSRTLTGSGAAWLLAGLREGDTLFLNGYAIPIVSIEANGSATLAYDWPGADVVDAPYRLRYQPDLSRMAAKVQTLIDGLDERKGDKGDPGANFSPDAIGTFAERAAFDAQAEGFSFLSTDGDAGATTTTASIFIRTGAAGGWGAPIPFAGEDGADAQLEVSANGQTVVAGAATGIDFAEVFGVAADPGAQGRALVDIDPSAILALLNAALGGPEWQGGGGTPQNVVTHEGIPLTHNGRLITFSGVV